MRGRWVEPDVRDGVVATVEGQARRCAIPRTKLLGWAEVGRSVYYGWRDRQGAGNRPGGVAPNPRAATAAEKAAVLAYARAHPGQGYRRLAYMMIDGDVACLSPSAVYGILKGGGLLGAPPRPSSKGGGFKQPSAPHRHWHIDFTYLNLSGTFYFLCAVLDGHSRAILAWDISPTMTAGDAGLVLQRAHELHPEAKPRVINDNGKQFVGRESTTLLKLHGFGQATTSPYHPQSNGKIERFNGSLKNECIYPAAPLTAEDARRVVAAYVEHYNNGRLHSAIGYVPPAAVLEGRREAIHEGRDEKLAKARAARHKHNENNTETKAAHSLAA